MNLVQKRKEGLREQNLMSLDYYKIAAALGEERFKIVSDWYHFAILELATLGDFKNDPKWISKKLGALTPIFTSSKTAQ